MEKSGWSICKHSQFSMPGGSIYIKAKATVTTGLPDHQPVAMMRTDPQGAGAQRSQPPVSCQSPAVPLLHGRP